MVYWIDWLNQALIIGIIAVSFNVMMGYGGIFSVANLALAGVAGYTAGYLSATHDVGFLACLAAGVGAAVLAGTLLSLPSMRLSDDYVIVLTIAFSTVLVAAILAIPALNGHNGLIGIRPIQIAGMELLRPEELLRFVAPLTVLCAAVTWRLVYSPFGRVMRGIREDQVATRALGKNVFAYKVLVFAFASGLAGVGGVALVYYVQIASPDQFDFVSVTTIIAAAVLGGLGTISGSLLGAFLLIMIDPLLEEVGGLQPETAALWRLVIFGALLLLVVRFRPVGLIQEGTSFRRRFARRPAEAPPADSSPTVEAGDLPAGDELPAEGAEALGLREGTEPSEPVVVARGLVKSFGGIRAVQGLDMALAPGRITALIGPNGAGKTTVFNLLTGEIRPDAGEIRLRGDDVTGLLPHQVARLGMVRTFQDVRTFRRMTVLDNVKIATQGHPGERLTALYLRPRAVARQERVVEEQARAALAFVGLEDRRDDWASSLGYGDQKLLAIARLLATNCNILLVDEPASGIDRSALEPVLVVLERLRDAGKTICVVEHNLDVVRRLADEVLFMEEGRVTGRGRMEDIVKQERLAQVYFGHEHV